MDQKRCKVGYAGTNVMYNFIFSNARRDNVEPVYLVISELYHPLSVMAANRKDKSVHNITTTKVSITHTSVQNGNFEGVNQILSILSLGAQTGQLGLSRIMQANGI